MATASTPTGDHVCDRCGEPVTGDAGTWQCDECRHAPRHGAD